MSASNGNGRPQGSMPGLTDAQRFVVAKLDRGVATAEEPEGFAMRALPTREDVFPVWSEQRQRRGRSTDREAFERWWRGVEEHP